MPRNISYISVSRKGLISFLLLSGLLVADLQAYRVLQQEEDMPLHRQFGFSRTKKPGGIATKPKDRARPRANPGNKNNRTDEPTDPLALGYSILNAKTIDGAEKILLSKNTEVFRLGDRIRLLIEANEKGYLYVFNTVNGKDPEMIFPSPRLNGGNNLVEAHVPHEIPSRNNENPKLRWFQFYPPPGTEEVYLVFSRTKISGLASGQELVKFCSRRDCSRIHPDTDVWERIVGFEKQEKIKEVLEIETQNLDEDINESVSRRIRLAPDDSKPTIIHQNRSKESGEIVVMVKLTSKSRSDSHYVEQSPAEAQKVSSAVADAAKVIVRAGYAEAIDKLEAVLAANPNDPEALSYMATAKLYRDGDFYKGRVYFDEAISNGGGPSFVVSHSHEISAMSVGDPNDYCRGWLHLRKGSVNFIADDGLHSFEIPFADIKEFQKNRMPKLFHIKLNNDKNYNFSPRSRNEREVLLIIIMYQKLSRK